MKRLLCLVGTLALSTPFLRAQIYADFETTLGDFTCELNHTAAPKTVANFIGLAQGTRKWVSPSGLIQENKPFYNGLIFHRVIAGFMNQSGCPLGTGTSGPGYAFPDETVGGPVHSSYVISMANAGGYTNGSQFFITVPRPSPLNFTHLDGNHTVFGTVVSGREIVDSINAVQTDAGDKPVVPVVIQSVVIRRIGASANNFDVQAQGLPEVQASSYDLSIGLPLEQRVEAVPRSPRSGFTTTTTYASQDLSTWAFVSQDYLGLGPSSSAAFPISMRYGFAVYPPREFYRFTDTLNADAMVPSSLAGKTVSAFWSGNTLVFNINAAGTGGTAVLNGEGTPRNILQIYEAQSPYDLIIEAAGLYPLKLSSRLTGSTGTLNSGPLKLAAYNGGWNLVGSGTLNITK